MTEEKDIQVKSKEKIEDLALGQFAKEVQEGLSASEKYLSSKYFYDDEGSRLFQEIMKLEAYYLTDSEFEIFHTQKDKILHSFRQNTGPVPSDGFQLLELGAGDGAKTKVLLDYFMQQKIDFSYRPVDISAGALSSLKRNMQRDLPDLKMAPLQGDYFQVMHELKGSESEKKVVLFLGSNIGNFPEKNAIAFLSTLGDLMNPGDQLLIGFDLKKEPSLILSAYNDPQGITKKFNLNLLSRINRELGGNFDGNNFLHYPVYDPHLGECRSYLVSKKSQDVHIDYLNESFHFEAWESIFMEISHKYSLRQISSMAQKAGFSQVDNFYDQKKYYVDSLWVRG